MMPAEAKQPQPSEGRPNVPTWIWCPICRMKQPITIATHGESADLLCDVCRCVVATMFYHPPAKKETT